MKHQSPSGCSPPSGLCSNGGSDGSATPRPNPEVSVQVEAEQAPHGHRPKVHRSIRMPNLPRPLNLEEKRFLLAVERGDIPSVRRYSVGQK